MTREVTIRMTVDSSGAVSGLRVLQTEAAKTGKNLTETGKAADNSGGAIKNIAGAVDFAMKAFAALKAFDMVSDFVNQGRAINATSSTFGALTANIGGATAVLQQLRDATGGVVTDLSLMQNSNRFLQMGLADTGEEAAKLAHIAVVLGGSMGKDAAGAMEEFALMLANQSIPRLDTFGISAGRVRTRINELMAETKGLTREQAFMQAVMEQADISIRKLGPAAEFGMNALSRLETSFANFVDTVKSQAAQGAVGIVDMISLLTETDPGHQHLKQVASEQATAYVDTFIASYGSQFQGRESEVQAFLQDMFYRSMTGQRTDALAMSFSDTGMKLFPGEFDLTALEAVTQQIMDTQRIKDALQPVNEQIKASVVELTQLADRRGAIFQEMADQQVSASQPLKNASDEMEGMLTMMMTRQRTLAGAQTIAVGITDIFNSIPSRISGFQTRMNQALQPRLDALKEYSLASEEMVAGLTPMLSGMNINPEGLFGSMKDIAMPEFMRPEAAQAIAEQFSVVEEEFQRMSELNAQGLITDDELARMGTFRDNMANINDQAQAAADAFEKMSLTDLLGTTGGGVMGEIGDMVTQAMKNAGMSEDAIAASQRQMDIASGRETVSSIAMQDVIAPMIAAMKPEDQVMAMQNLTAAMQEFTVKGGDINTLTPEQIAAMTGFGGGGGGGGASFEIKPGETLGEVQARLAQQGYQLAISDLLAATGAGSTATVQPGQYSVGQGGGAAIPGFNPMAYVQSLLNPAGATGGTPGTFPGALPGGGGNIQDMWGSFMGGIGGMMGGGAMPAGGMAQDTTLSMADTAADATAISTAMDASALSMTAMAEETIPAVNEALTPMADKVTILGDGFQKMYNQTAELTEQISTLTSQEYELVLNLKVKGDTATLYGINQAIALMGGGGGLANQVQNNNGRVPGSDPRAD